MALVICDKHDKCGHMACPWYKPRQEVEIGSAYCRHWAAEQGGTGGSNNVAIVAVSALYDLGKTNPNSAFKRKKHGF